MRIVRYSGRFKKDFRRVERRGYDLSRLDTILTIPREDKPLPPSARSHPLKGGWQGYSECHIDPDWLLIFKKAPQRVAARRNRNARGPLRRVRSSEPIAPHRTDLDAARQHRLGDRAH
jgi:mRNA interferase YafQ